ncbi:MULTISPECIES: HesA/MoeB/ThiF family protein [Acidithiobacillus]|uniref:HesA/MoeB/ThiF family protein n=1 Tax=Acidithiobacillus TaxID=119977 RepID=UPI000ADC9044|nr:MULTISPECIES: ThiF family adenylyltransferase [Acidithiobacillus]MEB8474939.1 ThiF family adenylyltransferase [Acidithiobacillus ferriphilus]
MSDAKVKKLEGIYSDEIYRQRVNRSQAWLGNSEKEQFAAQKAISESTVGVAGCGGIGGAIAMRLARLGVRHIKVADPDSFDWTNLNRQFGSSRETVGKNKAEVVGHLVHELAGDVTVEIFSGGITEKSAPQFVDGCDLILDQMDFYLLRERYALHQEFRKLRHAKAIISAWCIGWGSSMLKYTHDSMPIEEYFGVEKNAEMTPDVIKILLQKFMPEKPRFPGMDVLYDWFITRKTVPLFAGTPPVAEALAIQRVALILTDMEQEPYAAYLPPAPAYYMYDASTLEGHLINPLPFI